MPGLPVGDGADHIGVQAVLDGREAQDVHEGDDPSPFGQAAAFAAQDLMGCRRRQHAQPQAAGLLGGTKGDRELLQPRERGRTGRLPRRVELGDEITKGRMGLVVRHSYRSILGGRGSTASSRDRARTRDDKSPRTHIPLLKVIRDQHFIRDSDSPHRLRTGQDDLG
jgi:hypothetical protein